MTCILCELDKYDGDQNKEGAIWQISQIPLINNIKFKLLASVWKCPKHDSHSASYPILYGSVIHPCDFHQIWDSDCVWYWLKKTAFFTI